ncbi:MAG: dolichyl-diphosphooligosaccharide--protein glycosyltransferase subunit 1 [Thaumarchaeota archaeon]|nr:dolichyl-diphosphooligosaccharide--protein glycosyltransferase subunit 1 [Nitrososphaerota archaeon]
MKPLAVLSAVVSLLPFATAASSDDATASHVRLPATFKPPQVFKNTNLVHIISLEKNFAKESINVAIENIDKEPQDEYYIPFTPDEMERIGGIEVKDRKDANVGPFKVQAVEYDPER